MSETWYRWDGDTLILAVRVQPRAGRDQVIGPVGEHLKVRIAAAPVDGSANAGLLRFMAREFKVPRGRVRLLAGERAREKRVAVRAPGARPDWLP